MTRIATNPKSLFKADIFSESTPYFTPVSEALRTSVTWLIRHHYPFVGQISNVDQAGGPEINSNNFRITGTEGRFLLKRFSSKKSRDELKRELLVLLWLNEKQNHVPALFKSTSGDEAVKYQSELWCLFGFVEGTFYSGASAELPSTSSAIGRLHATLASLPSNEHPPKKWDYFSSRDKSLLLELNALRPQWPEIFGANFSSLLRENVEIIEVRQAELNEHEEEILGTELQTAHGDIHPYNLLIQSGHFASFLDFESYNLMPVDAAIGYGTYKLLKQHVIKDGLKDETSLIGTTDMFIDKIREKFPRLSPKPRLRLFASLELFRRLLLVLRINLDQKNQIWNHVIPMHLDGLREIDLIFGVES